MAENEMKWDNKNIYILPRKLYYDKNLLGWFVQIGREWNEVK